MLAMEKPPRYGRMTNSNSFRQRRSGYEPSDTETEWHEWQESPWRDLKNEDDFMAERPRTPPVRHVSPHGRSKRYSSNHDYLSPAPRRNSKSPYKPHRDLIQEIIAVSPNLDGLEIKRNVSPYSKSQRRHVSLYKTRGDEPKPDEEDCVNLNRKSNRRTPPKYLDLETVKAEELSRVSERSNYSHRSVTAPRQRPVSRTPSPLPRNPVKTPSKTHHIRAPSASQINEMVGMATLSKSPNGAIKDDVESNSLGSIFFSREYATFAAQQKSVLAKKNDVRVQALPSRPEVIPESITESNLKTRVQTPYIPKTHTVPITKYVTRTNSSSTVSRQSTSKSTEGSGRSSDSLRKFTANRKKVQKDTWFNCMSKGPCKLSKSPERKDLDEASFIGKAFVVENLREFWTEKHRPSSLSGFNCHKHQAQLLKQLTSRNSFPHILFKGPSGSGKKALTMALLHEIFGDPAWDISHELRRFQSQENRAVEVVVPIVSSPHHVELDLEKEWKNARYALMALVKEMAGNVITPDISTISFRADYKVIVLYKVDKAPENIQHLIKWIMDCYSDSCKLILCCDDDVKILDSVKTRCEVFKIEAPVTHEIMEVLIQIARKESFDLPMSFAAKIATKSKQNLRKAIMALEACKAHNYPFLTEQPIPFSWEEVLMELAAEILADPSPKRLFYTRGKLQKLLVDFVHPKLILQKLVEQFLKGVETNLKRELYYWHSYYDKRLPAGTSALLKLEEFVAKFMSIYRKSFRARPSP